MTQDDRSTSRRRLPLSTILPFSTPNLPIAALSVAVFVYLPPYFSGHLGVTMVTIGFVWMAVRLLDIPVDVFLALGMDRTRTQLGRYRLWLMLGAPVLMLALYRLFMAPHGFSGGYLFGWLAVMYLGTSIVSLAHQAWTSTLSTDYNERSRLFSIITAVGVVGVMAVLAIVIGAPTLKFSDAQGVRAAGWFIIALIPLTIGLAVLRTPEDIPVDAKSERIPWRDYWEVLTKPDLLRLFLASMALTLGPGWMSAIYLFFFTDSRGFTTQQASILLAVYVLAGIPGALLTAALARRIGKHRTLMVTTSAFSLGLLAVFILPKANLLAFLPAMAFEGAMASGYGLLTQAMLADVGDEVRLDQGKQRISLLYAVNALAAKLAAAFAIGLTFPLLASLGFNPADGVVNTPTAIHNLDLAFIIGPIVFVMLGGACVIGWRLDAKRHGEIRARLEARDAELATGAPPLDLLARPPMDPEIVG